MNTLQKTGASIYAIGIIALGILCFISKDFIVGRPPAWPADVQPNPILAYVSGAILVVAALAVLARQKVAAAAFTIAGLILFLSVFRHLPRFMNDWANAYKAMALFGGSLIIGTMGLPPAANTGNNASIRSWLITAGCVLLAAFFLMGGYAHFKYAAFVESLIPAFIPFHAFWTYLCGVFLLAGGVGLLLPQTRRLAALLSGIMIAGWFVLLHVPRFLADTQNVSDRLGLFESFTFVGIFFVLAGILPAKK